MLLIMEMIESDSCKIGKHELCDSKSCECGCHSELIRPPSERIQEDRAYMEGIPSAE